MGHNIGKAYKGWEVDDGQETGTTSNHTYNGATTLAWDSKKLSEKTIIIKNTGGTNAIDYKIEGRAYSSGNLAEIVADAEIAHSTTIIQKINDYYHDILVSVKSAVDSTHSTYTIEYGGRFLA